MNLRRLLYFWRKPAPLETKLVKLFMENPQVYVEPLISHFAQGERFSGGTMYYFSPAGEVKVCKDIYGPEVTLGGRRELLDCCPESYGLTRLQGDRLYAAILSNVPGTCYFKERALKGIENAET